MSSATFASQTYVGETGIVDERLLSKQRELASLPDARLQHEVTKALRLELDLPADQRRRHVMGRLRSWLILEPEDARRISETFARALNDFEPEERHTIREAEEDAIMDGLSYREFERLAAVMPSLCHWQVPFWDELPRGAIPNSVAAALALAGTSEF